MTQKEEDDIQECLDEASRTVATWPKWKQQILGWMGPGPEGLKDKYIEPGYRENE